VDVDDTSVVVVVVVVEAPFAEQATTIIKRGAGQRIDFNVAASGPQLRRAAT
jgi:hypothetical protein